MVGSRHREGPVGDDAVEMMTRHRIGQDRVVDASADKQSGVRTLCCECLDRVAQRVETMHTRQMQIVKLGRAAEQMHMRFDEAWQDRAAPGIDDAGAGPFVVANAIAICDRNYLIAFDGNGLGGGNVWIHRQYAGILDDQIGRLRHHFLPSGPRLAEYWHLTSRPVLDRTNNLRCHLAAPKLSATKLSETRGT